MMKIGTIEQKKCYFYPHEFSTYTSSYDEQSGNERFINRQNSFLNLRLGKINTNEMKFELNFNAALTIHNWRNFNQENDSYYYFDANKDIEEIVFVNIILLFLKHKLSISEIRYQMKSKKIYNWKDEDREFYIVPKNNYFLFGDSYLITLSDTIPYSRICIRLPNNYNLIINGFQHSSLLELLQLLKKEISDKIMLQQINSILNFDCNCKLNDKIGIINFPIHLRDLNSALPVLPIDICRIVEDYLFNDQELKKLFLNQNLSNSYNQLICNPILKDRLKFYQRWLCENDVFQKQILIEARLRNIEKTYYYDPNQNIRDELFEEAMCKFKPEALLEIRIEKISLNPAKIPKPKWIDLDFDYPILRTFGEICLYNIAGGILWDSFYEINQFGQEALDIGICIDEIYYYFWEFLNEDLVTKKFQLMMLAIPFTKRIYSQECVDEILIFLKSNVKMISRCDGLIDCKILGKPTRKRRMNGNSMNFQKISCAFR